MPRRVQPAAVPAAEVAAGVDDAAADPALRRHAASIELAGASPFPRHWVYDASRRAGRRRPASPTGRGGSGSRRGRPRRGVTQDSPVVVTAAETALERELSALLMHGAQRPRDPRVRTRRGRRGPGRARGVAVPRAGRHRRASTWTAAGSATSGRGPYSGSAPCSRAVRARRPWREHGGPDRGGAGGRRRPRRALAPGRGSPARAGTRCRRGVRIALLGVRGSTPAPGQDFVRYGGHTSCVAVFADDDAVPRLLLDAGTGLQRLPALLDGAAFCGDIVLTHLHWDHVQGLPFCPRRRPAGCARSACTSPLKRTLTRCRYCGAGFSPPHFPIGPEGLAGRWQICALADELTAGVRSCRPARSSTRAGGRSVYGWR